MAPSNITSDVTRGRQEVAPHEEEDSDTIEVIPPTRSDRKRRRSDGGVHVEGSFEGSAAKSTETQEKAHGAPEATINSLHSTSGKMQKPSVPASKEGFDNDTGVAFNQPLINADQLVLLPLTTIKALQNEITELKSTVVAFREDTLERFDRQDMFNALHAVAEVERESLITEVERESSVAEVERESLVAEVERKSSVDDDNCSEPDLEQDRAARRVAIDRIRRLARNYHCGKERTHLEFMADIVGVEDKSKLPVGHSFQMIPDPEFRAYARQRLLEDYVTQLWRHTYEGTFAKPDFVALGEDVERLYGCDNL